ncbi:Purine nucleoside phosphorylase [Phytophthora cinnamomi]|uniref:Purine nucleoside phosphorylase n=1 Tax=Phytophthora cinnamomi TaxID=4785 RepID=UPI00355A4602|nr:Purine nucleoside phosphorylase [Phytophthora cinnamomi]
MSSGGRAWGRPGRGAGAVAAAASPVAVKLHDVMDEELAAKLQREEQEQWEREMEGRFGGDDRQTGWCFVEVPSSSSGHGVMSVIQQEVTVEDAREDDDDPDYTFALELQAQEAEEYDRMRRQEASSMERIRVVQQEDPKREEVRQTLQRYYDREAHRELDRDEPVEVHTTRTSTTTYMDGSGWRVPKKSFNALNSAMKHSDRKSRHRSKNSSSSSSGGAPTHRI